MAGLRVGCFMRKQFSCCVKPDSLSAARRLISSDSQRWDIGIAIIQWRLFLQSCAERCQRHTTEKCSSLLRGQCIESGPAATVNPAVQHGEQRPAVRPAMPGLIVASADCPCMPAECQKVGCDIGPGTYQIPVRSTGHRTEAQLTGWTCIRNEEHQCTIMEGCSP